MSRQPIKIQFNDFLAWERSTYDTVDFKKTYVDMCGGDLIAGMMLSDLIFWRIPNQKGEDKRRIEMDNKLWIAVTDEEWFERLRLSKKQARRAKKALEDLGIIETRIKKFNGAPTTHFYLNEDDFLTAWSQILYGENTDEGANGNYPKGNNEITQRAITKLPKGQNENYPKGKMKIAERGNSLTETTTEHTTETTNKKKQNDIQPTAGGASHRDRARENSETNQSTGTTNQTAKPPKTTDDEESVFLSDHVQKYLDEILSAPPVEEVVEEPEPIEYPDAYTQRIVAVQDAFKLNPSDTGFAKVLEAQLTGRSKKGKRGEFVLEKPMNAHEILAFGEWWVEQAKLNEWSQKTPPTSAETLYERALEFRSHRNYGGAIRQSSLRLEQLRIEPDPRWVKIAHLHPPVRY
jgi:hypothetical protein